MADSHYCKIHKTPWFKKGKMRGYAHPIGDTGEWCNEEDTPEDTPTKETTKPASAPESVKPQMSRDDWAEKDNVTRKSIERQTALNAAVKVAELMQLSGVTTEKIISTAKRFELYLETGVDLASLKEVTGAKTNLVAAIKA